LDKPVPEKETAIKERRAQREAGDDAEVRGGDRQPPVEAEGIDGRNIVPSSAQPSS